MHCTQKNFARYLQLIGLKVKIFIPMYEPLEVAKCENLNNCKSFDINRSFFDKS